jgi:hypothetical protein
MPDSTLIASTGTERITRDQLALLPTPAGTLTHRPIPHHQIVDALVETLGFRHIAVHSMEFAVDRTGNKCFGLIELEHGFTGARFAIGLRNANDKSMRLALTVGYRVMVCSNMAFHGDFQPVLAKHTRNFDLLPALSYGVDQMQRNFEPLVKAVDRWKDTQLSDVSAKLLIYEAFVEAATDLPKHLLRPVHDYYFQPPHEEFAPRTLWSLQNSFTGAIKTLDPVPAFKATSEVAHFFEARKL